MAAAAAVAGLVPHLHIVVVVAAAAAACPPDGAIISDDCDIIRVA